MNDQSKGQAFSHPFGQDSGNEGCAALVDPKIGLDRLNRRIFAVEQLLFDGFEELVNQRSQARGIVFEGELKSDLPPVAGSSWKTDWHVNWGGGRLKISSW